MPLTRSRRVALTLGAAGLLAGGGVAVAQAATSPTPSPSAPSAAPSAGGSSGQTPPAPPKHQPHLDGTVTAVGSDTITITDPEGFTRLVRTTGSTAYVDGSTTKDRSAVTVGKHVHAEGTVDTDKTSLDATRVDVGTPPAPGKDGPKPPSGGPKPPAPPSGAPSGAPSSVTSSAPSAAPSSSASPATGS